MKRAGLFIFLLPVCFVAVAQIPQTAMWDMVTASQRSTATEDTTAKFDVTMTGAGTATIAELTVSSQMTVDWGDGTTTNYTGGGARTKTYAGAGTYTVKLMTPSLVTKLTLSDNKITLNSSNVMNMVNVTNFVVTAIKAGRFDSSDVSAWRPTDFRLFSMPSGYAGTFNSTDVSAWTPTYFLLYSMPSGYAGTFDSSDVTAWRPTDFRVNSMPAGYAGTFDSSDVSAWRPTDFLLYSMPSGYAGTFNSSDVTAWRPTDFNLRSMPSGYAGTFDSSDVSAWRPTTFRLYSMPSGYVFSLLSTGGFANWTNATTVNLSANSLAQTNVDNTLAALWAGFATRSASGGTITLNGTGNATPGGTYQSNCPPTTGLEYRYGLLVDPCSTNSTKKWTTISVN